ncbi:MAG: hypothetical protein FJ189_05555, partial [Gammaproteobacteria bacterium]|nr:hypothetical protein [Gammaproteobacteria bacterium]
DSKSSRIAEVDIAGYRMDAPALAADGRQPATLILAGLQHPCCQAVLALTDDDHTNVAVAAAARLLRPDVPVVCRAEHPAVAADMALFEVEHIIDPHAKFGDYLVTAIQSPGSYQLQQWLTGMPGTSLGRQTEPPRGCWLVYGDGRFAAAVSKQLKRAGIDVTELPPQGGRSALRDEGTAAPDEGLVAQLDRSGIHDAAGFVAGTDDDVRNLAIVVAARRLNPRLFFVLRQNREAAQPLFAAFRSDITVTSPEIVVHECLARLTTPLLPRFLGTVAERDDAWADATLLKLRGIVSREVPAIWTVELSAAASPACADFLRDSGQTLRLDHLIRDPDNREAHLHCVPLLVARQDNSEWCMPAPDTAVTTGDRILFAGTPDCQLKQAATLLNVNVLHYVYFGRHVPGSWIMRRLLLRPGGSAH